MRVIVLVDGEHYPPVTRWGIETARARGHDVVGALFVGGSEKLPPGPTPDLGVPTRLSGTDRMAALGLAIDEFVPEAVLDLSDEPVLGYRERMELVGVTLARGLPYMGADFRLDPPIDGPPLPVPTLAVIGTGKRTGKTAISGALARLAARRGLDPVIVAMGRGGPAEPAGRRGRFRRLWRGCSRWSGRASTRLRTTWRTRSPRASPRSARGGWAAAWRARRTPRTSGRPPTSPSTRGAGILILEGSGSAVPPVPWDAGVLVTPASVPVEYLAGYLGPFRLLLSDLVVVTMASGPVAGHEHLSALRSHIRRFLDDSRQIVTDFIPVPLVDVKGERVFFTTTAPPSVAERQIAHLEATHGCTVVGWSTRLADRAGLTEDMGGAERFDVLLTELKAAAVDVACELALERGAEVVFVDNRAIVVEGPTDLDSSLGEVIDLSLERGRGRAR